MPLRLSSSSPCLLFAPLCSRRCIRYPSLVPVSVVFLLDSAYVARCPPNPPLLFPSSAFDAPLPPASRALERCAALWFSYLPIHHLLFTFLRSQDRMGHLPSLFISLLDALPVLLLRHSNGVLPAFLTYALIPGFQAENRYSLRCLHCG